MGYIQLQSVYQRIMDNETTNETIANVEATTYRLITNNVYEVIGIFGIIFNGLVLACSIPTKNIQTIILSGNLYQIHLIGIS